MSTAKPVLVGVPFDGASSFLKGPAAAPEAVRRALHCGSANYTTERGVELDPVVDVWTDAGDVSVPSGPAEAFDAIRSAATELGADAPIVAVGGDHFITWPLVSALADRHANLTIVHVDAHPDLYDALDGERLSHATPFARIMEEGLATRLLQFGIRTMNTHQQEQVDRFGVEVFTAAGWDGTSPVLKGDVYITIDVDGLDPAHAPGVSHHEPGGLTSRQVIGLIHQVKDMQSVRVVGADVVEINPSRDIHDMTAMLGAKLVKELLGTIVGA
ncbi:MAG: agmatinase [Acidimicrobiales bacterium]